MLLCSMKNYTRRVNYRPRPLAKNKIKLVIAIAIIAAATLLFLPQKAVSITPQISATSTVADVPLLKAVEQPKAKPIPQIGYAQSYKWSTTTEATIENKLNAAFSPADARIALAILKQESSLNANAVNYNCWYDANGVASSTRSAGMKSKPCAKADRHLTWSIDCGVGQFNFVGLKVCPAYTKDLDWTVKRMVDFHKERGFKPWVAYTSGRYIPFLK